MIMLTYPCRWHAHQILLFLCNNRRVCPSRLEAHHGMVRTEPFSKLFPTWHIIFQLPARRYEELDDLMQRKHSGRHRHTSKYIWIWIVTLKKKKLTPSKLLKSRTRLHSSSVSVYCLIFCRFSAFVSFILSLYTNVLTSCLVAIK